MLITAFLQPSQGWVSKPAQMSGLVVKVLDSESRGPFCSKPLGGSKVDSAFHPSEVDKMSTRNFRELNGKK